ncbi:hypothetical protein ACEPPN_012594 [Leptodophora sp. 'Broadleaf-Isolate-01']
MASSIAALVRKLDQSQVISSAKKFREIWSAVKDAPGTVADLLDEVYLLAETLDQLGNLDQNRVPAIENVLKFVAGRMERLEVLLKELDGGMQRKGFRERSQWGGLRLFVNEKVLGKAVDNLERARTMMQVALSVHQV